MSIYQIMMEMSRSRNKRTSKALQYMRVQVAMATVEWDRTKTNWLKKSAYKWADFITKNKNIVIKIENL